MKLFSGTISEKEWKISLFMWDCPFEDSQVNWARRALKMRGWAAAQPIKHLLCAAAALFVCAWNSPFALSLHSRIACKTYQPSRCTHTPLARHLFVCIHLHRREELKINSARAAPALLLPAGVRRPEIKKKTCAFCPFMYVYKRKAFSARVYKVKVHIFACGANRTV